MTKRSRKSARADDGPCVWMEAGVIDYWLCDRDFHCETCPLDMALRGRFPDRARHAASTPWVPEALKFHRSHIWVNPTNGSKWTVGLDFHALHAFSDLPTLSLPRPGRRITKGSVLLSMLVEGDALRWPAPMDAIVLERNDNWKHNGHDLREHPYTDGWALLLKVEQPPNPAVWIDANTLQASCTAERTALRDMCHSTAQGQSALGTTAADGGDLESPPDRILPRPLYLTFLRERWGLILPDSAF